MCRMCDAGWPLDKVLQLYRARIRREGWAAVHVAGAAGAAGYSYTIGLTRLHGRPEVLLSGQPPEVAAGQLGFIVSNARAGQWFKAGMVFPGAGDGRVQFAQVDDPDQLPHAQQIYAWSGGKVPALQAIWTDPEGHWPWSPGWPAAPTAQPLFGTPLHT
jgi:hypothetical protein